MTVRQFLDLTTTVALAIIGLLAVVVVGSSPVTLLAVLPLLLVLPGFAIVSAIYPGVGPESIGSVGRFALSVALSAAVTPMVAMAANYTVGVYPLPIVAGVAVITVSMSLIAAGRRAALPDDERAGALPFSWTARTFERYLRGTRSLKSTSPLEATSGRDVLLNLAIVATILVFAASIGFAALVPQGDGVTETYLATTNGDSLTLVQNANDLSQEERDSLVAVVENEEGQSMQYTVVVAAQDVSQTDDGVRVDGEEILVEESATLNDGDTWHVPVPTADADRTVVSIHQGEANGEPDYRLVLQEP